jgi:hypothetical protein
MRGIFLLHCFFVACYAASIIDLYFQFDLYGAFYLTAMITPFYSLVGILFLYVLGGFLVFLHERARHIYQLCFNPETVTAGETWDSSFCCWCGETLVLFCAQLFLPGIFGFCLYAFTMDFLDKPTPVWHAILSYFYMVWFYLWVALWNASGGFLQEDYGTVRSSDTAQQDDGIHEVVKIRVGDVAESYVELRRLEEQEETTLNKDETATVTTEEDDDDRRQTIDSLDDFA